MTLERSRWLDAPTASEAPAPTHADDLELVGQVLAGDPAAWTRFVETYAGLILSVVRKYLRSRDTDDVRSVFADILVALRRSKLRTYEGRAALSTWLTLVARTATLDFLRRRFGRGRYARALERLAPAERTLFRLFYLEGRSPHAIVTQMSHTGDPWTLDRFVASLRRIETRLGDAWLRRLAYDLHAQSVGAASGRMLEYLDHVREQFEQHPGAYSPDYYLLEREARHTADRLVEMMGTLEPRERELLRMRFERGWTAREIADQLGLEGARGVYTTTERIVRKLRRWLEGPGT
jgi:DNA-directed RNA polymerase specialized sigma24 family protein